MGKSTSKSSAYKVKDAKIKQEDDDSAASKQFKMDESSSSSSDSSSSSEDEFVQKRLMNAPDEKIHTRKRKAQIQSTNSSKNVSKAPFKKPASNVKEVATASKRGKSNSKSSASNVKEVKIKHENEDSAASQQFKMDESSSSSSDLSSSSEDEFVQKSLVNAPAEKIHTRKRKAQVTSLDNKAKTPISKELSSSSSSSEDIKSAKKTKAAKRPRKSNGRSSRVKRQRVQRTNKGRGQVKDEPKVEIKSHVMKNEQGGRKVENDIETILTVERHPGSDDRLDIDLDTIVDPKSSHPMTVHTHAEVDQDQMKVVGEAEAKEAEGTAEIKGEITHSGLHDEGAINLDVIEKSEDSDSINLQAKVKKAQTKMDEKKDFKWDDVD